MVWLLAVVVVVVAVVVVLVLLLLLLLAPPSVLTLLVMQPKCRTVPLNCRRLQSKTIYYVREEERGRPSSSLTFRACGSVFSYVTPSVFS